VTVESIDVGYWTGSITYSPTWSALPITISIGTGPDPVYGIAWIWERLEGWDSPDVVGSVLQRGADHGGWAAGQWYAPRALTLQLRASAPTQATRDIARSLLQQVCPPNDLALLQYNEPIPKQVYFRRAGKISETYDNLTEVDFACVLICPDPRKYSQTLHVWPIATWIESNYTTVGTNNDGTNNPIGNTDFASGSLTNWVAFNGSIAATASPPAGGPTTSGYAVVLTPNGTGAAPSLEASALGNQFYVTPGQRISISAGLYPESSSFQGYIGYDFFVPGPTYLSTTVATPSLTASTWQNESSGTITVPSGANIASPRVGLNGTPASANTLTIEHVIAAAEGFTTLPWTFPNNVNPATSAATNAGNFETRPVITIQGPLHSPGIMYANTGQQVTFSTVNLSIGDILLIDLDSRTAFLNLTYYLITDVPPRLQPAVIGSALSPSSVGSSPAGSPPISVGSHNVVADISSQWFVLWPGFNSIQLLSGQNVITDSGQMLVYHRDAWI
jgi:hypothetical protein